MMRRLMVLAMVLGLTGAALAGEGLAVLNNRSVLRTFSVFKTPVVVSADGKFVPPVIPGRKPTPIPAFQSALPDGAWRSAEFNDSAWSQARTPLEAYRGVATGRSMVALHTATKNSLICARAKFIVADPAGVKGMKLSLTYVGGVVVYINGKEIARAHLPAPSKVAGPKGELKHDALAEKYPDDLYVDAGNKYQQNITEKNRASFERRYRHLKDVSVPAAALRKGVNVLAVEVHRSPVNEAAAKSTRWAEGGMYRVPGLWAYTALRSVDLTAAPGSTVTPNVGRPDGVQVWNCDPFDTISVMSYGEPVASVAPVAISGLRNGVFSGRFVVSSPSAIDGLKATVSDLALPNGGAKLPKSAVQVRCGRRAVPDESWRSGVLFDGLDDAVPAQVTVYKGRGASADAGAVAPVWITVRVPKDATPGTYAGTVTVQANGLKPTEVPVTLTVYGWALPDPIDFRVRHLNQSSVYSLALHYGVPYWSDKHFKLIGKSLDLMAAINARRIDVDLAVSVRYGSAPIENSMVKWIKAKDGTYTYDFSALDKYFDLIEKTIKKPLPLRVNCWGDINRKTRTQWVTAKWVALLDPATGKLSRLDTPPPATEENYKFWKPVLDQLRKRIEKRGWAGAMAVGHQSYCWPPDPDVVAVAKRIWPDAVWSYTAHNGTLGGSFGARGKGMPVFYSECVWTEGRPSARGYRALLAPGRDKMIWNSVARNRHKDNSPLVTFIRIPEEMILRGHDGVGYICIDFLPIPSPKRKGRYYALSAGHGGVRGRSSQAIVAAGPDGPMATGHYEMLREGVQQCEAIICLQRALDGKKITGDLAKRVDAYLNERGNAFVKGWHAGRIDRDRRLFALVAEAAKAAK